MKRNISGLRLGLMVGAMILFTVVAVRAEVAQSPWPMAGHDPSQTFRTSTATGIETPTVLWSVTVPWHSYNLSLDAEETVYIGGKDWNLASGSLMAISQSGLKWSQTKDAHWSYIFPTSTYFRTAAVANDGTIFDGNYGSVYALYCSIGSNCYDPAWEMNKFLAIAPDGSVKWQLDIEGSSSNPTIGPDGTVYFATAHGIDPQDYTPVKPWRPAPENFFYAYNQDGTLQWELSLGIYQVQRNIAVAPDGMIYFSLRAKYCHLREGTWSAQYDYTYDYKVMAVNPDGSVAWELQEDPKFGDRGINLAADGTIYLSNPKGINALDRNGNLIWTAPGTRGVIGPDGNLYYVYNENVIDPPGSYSKRSMAYLAARNSDGSDKWTVFVNGHPGVTVLTDPAVDAEGKIFLVDHQGVFRVFSSTGQALASIPLAEITHIHTSVWEASLILGKNLAYVYILPRSLDPDGTSGIGPAKLIAIGNLYPASDLTAVPQPDATIKLDWLISPTPTTAGYNVYLGDDPAGINYSAAYDTVAHPQDTYTTAVLPPGQHCFGLRAFDGKGTEEKNTNLVACATIAPPSCLAGARIKTPKAGKRIAGERVTVMAEIIGDPALVDQVLFQARFPGQSEWVNLTAAGHHHPNPDSTAPYFIHVDVSDPEVTPEGDYGLRAVVTDVAGCNDPNPESILVTVDNHHPCERELVNSEGSHAKDAQVFYAAPSLVVAAEPGSERMVELYLPAKNIDTDLGQLELSFPRCAPFVQGDLAGIGECRQVRLGDGQSRLGADTPAEITISYEDPDHDGIVANTFFEDELEILHFNAGTGAWEPLPSRVDKEAKAVTAQTTQFSLFALGGNLPERLTGNQKNHAANDGLFGCGLAGAPSPHRGANLIALFALAAAAAGLVRLRRGRSS